VLFDLAQRGQLEIGIYSQAARGHRTRGADSDRALHMLESPFLA